MLRKSPVFTTVVVLVVALGSGAVTTIFSAMNSAPPPPYSGRCRPRPSGDAAAHSVPTVCSFNRARFASIADLRERSRTLAGIAAWGKVSLTIADRAEDTTVWGNLVSGELFRGAWRAPLARTILPAGRRSNAPRLSRHCRVARILADRAWPATQPRSAVPSRERQPFTFIGVAANGFSRHLYRHPG